MNKSNCLDCKKLDYLDNCDNCRKEFCYECLGIINNNLYCENCYRIKKEVNDDEKIIKHKEKVGNLTSYSWEIRKAKW